MPAELQLRQPQLHYENRAQHGCSQWRGTMPLSKLFAFFCHMVVALCSVKEINQPYILRSIVWCSVFLNAEVVE